MEKLDIKRLQKKYVPADKRPSMRAEKDEDYKAAFHCQPNTPTAEELMHPPVAAGEGTSYDAAPYLTVKDLPYNWLDTMRAEAAQGRGPTSFARALGLTRAGFETLLATSPEFAEAFERCKLLSAEWWEDRGRDLTLNGNGTVWLANMVNRWGWNSNKQESTSRVTQTSRVAVAGELSKEELDAELEKRGLSLQNFDDTL